MCDHTERKYYIRSYRQDHDCRDHRECNQCCAKKDSKSEKRAREFLGSQVQKCVVKSKTAQKGVVELNLEIRMKEDNTDFVNELSEMDGVNSAILVSYLNDIVQA